MLIFDKSYNLAVTKYIIPLSNHGVSYSKLRQDAVKALLIEKPFLVESIGPTEARLLFRKEDLLKAINNRILCINSAGILQRLHNGETL